MGRVADLEKRLGKVLARVGPLGAAATQGPKGGPEVENEVQRIHKAGVSKLAQREQIDSLAHAVTILQTAAPADSAALRALQAQLQDQRLQYTLQKPEGTRLRDADMALERRKAAVRRAEQRCQGALQEQTRVQERALAELAVAAHLVHDANQLMEAAQLDLQKAKEEKAIVLGSMQGEATRKAVDGLTRKAIQDLLDPKDPEDHVLWGAIWTRMEQRRIRDAAAIADPVADVSMRRGSETLADTGSQPVPGTFGEQAVRAPTTPAGVAAMAGASASGTPGRRSQSRSRSPERGRAAEPGEREARDFVGLAIRAHRDAGLAGTLEALAEAQRVLWEEAAKLVQGAEDL